MPRFLVMCVQQILSDFLLICPPGGIVPLHEYYHDYFQWTITYAISFILSGTVPYPKFRMHFLWIRIRAPPRGYRLFWIFIPRDGSTGPGVILLYLLFQLWSRSETGQSSHNIVLIPGLWIHIWFRMDPHQSKKLDSNPGSRSASKSKGRKCNEAKNAAMEGSGRSQWRRGSSKWSRGGSVDRIRIVARRQIPSYRSLVCSLCCFIVNLITQPICTLFT